MFVTSFSLITLAQSRQSILESMRDSLTAVVSNMPDVVVNMTDTVVASVVVSLSEKKKNPKNYLVSKYSFIRNVFA